MFDMKMKPPRVIIAPQYNGESDRCNRKCRLIEQHRLCQAFALLVAEVIFSARLYRIAVGIKVCFRQRFRS
ncbi:hypothetical protein D3C75_1299010 [compost metagenome]